MTNYGKKIYTFFNFCLYFWSNVHAHTRAVTTMTTELVCTKCGTVKKSGKISCCGRGGSWFGNCGGRVGNADVHHTWYEGIKACKTQSKRVRVRQSNSAHRKNSFNSVGTGNSRAIMTTARAFAHMPINTPIRNTPIAALTITSMNKFTTNLDNTYAEYDTDNGNLKSITMTPTAIISTVVLVCRLKCFYSLFI